VEVEEVGAASRVVAAAVGAVASRAVVVEVSVEKELPAGGASRRGLRRPEVGPEEEAVLRP
jgi:hypothetical protein